MYISATCVWPKYCTPKKNANLWTSNPIKEKSTTKTLPFLPNAYEAEAINGWPCDANNYDAECLNITGSIPKKLQKKRKTTATSAAK